MHVRVLADEVINKIAAGEVVERPASVVRELVDNALDSGATEIQVVLEDGGQRLVRVIDNGCGMERDDALLALERHATSKLSSADDLLSIATLGFRGEALPSIAAVSRMTLRTRPSGQAHATEILIEGGIIKAVQDSAGTPGTQVEVRQLFFNTPARRKFLKSARTEEMRIRAWLVSASLSRPEVRLRLLSDGKELLTLPQADSLRARAATLYRGETRYCETARAGVEVSGLISHPSQAQHDATAFVVIVNGRVISDRLIMRAVREGFDSTLKDREFPLGFLSISLPAADVDVNVHPQKSEVRFRNPNAVFEAVRSAVGEAVQQFDSPLQGVTPFSGANAAAVRREPQFVAQPMPLYARPQMGAFSPVQSSESYSSHEAGHPVLPAPPLEGSGRGVFRFSDLRYLGQLLECYLVCELQDSLYLVDMHAAHERINYNRIRNALRDRDMASQQLLVPVAVHLSADGLARCLEHQAVFAQFGFEWDALGEDTLVVRAVPGFLRDGRVVAIVKELAAISEEMDPQTAFRTHLDSIAARLACHASIRSGKAMEREEVYALFAALDDSRFSAACPHGRPVCVSFSHAAIESWFGRDR